MAIIPWLKGPGRPLKKRFAPKARVPRPRILHDYIVLPTPLDVPREIWENVIKDLNQSFRISYREITSVRLVADETEFEEQPGAVGIAITSDPRRYLKKGVGVVFLDTFKEWLKSVISWSDFDVIAEQRGVWRKLLRGQNGGVLPGILEETSPGSGVYKGKDRERYVRFHKRRGARRFDPRKDTPYEVLGKNVEEWIRYGKSRSDRLGRWNMVQRAWLDAVGEDILVRGGPRSERVRRFFEKLNDIGALNNWVYATGKPTGYRALPSNPFVNALESAPDYTSAFSALRTALQGEGIAGGDITIFSYLAEKKLRKKWEEEVRAGTRAALPDFAHLTGRDLSDYQEAVLEEAKGFYSKKILLFGGQLFALNDLITDPRVPARVKWAALRKHKSLQYYANRLTAQIKSGLDEMHFEAEEESFKRLLIREGANPDLFEWQKVLRFRESVFLVSDFLEAAFDQNSLFRTYIYLGRISRRLPDWMGDWSSRLRYFTPAFYVRGVLDRINNKLGLANTGNTRFPFRWFSNAAYIPMLGGKEVLLYAKDFAGVWSVYNKLEDLVKEGAISSGLERAALADRLSILDILLNRGDLTQDQVDAYRNFLNSGIFQQLLRKGLIDRKRLDNFYSLLKGKLRDPKHRFAGPLVRIGRFLDHLQNLMYRFPLFGRILKKYADIMKWGYATFERRWTNLVFVKSVRDFGTKLKILAKWRGIIGWSSIKAKFAGTLGRFLIWVSSALGAVVFAVSSYVIGKLFSDIWNLLRGRPAKGFKEAGKKLLYAVYGTAGCCVGFVALVIFLLVIVVGSIFGVVGKVVNYFIPGPLSGRLEVAKIGVYDGPTRSINYTITVRNISEGDVEIHFDSDKVTVVLKDCSEKQKEFESSSGYGILFYDSDFDGTLEEHSTFSDFLKHFKDPISGEEVEYLLLKSGEEKSFSYKISNIPPSVIDATYLNTLDIRIRRPGPAPDVRGSKSSMTNIGGGGCAAKLGLASVADLAAGCLLKEAGEHGTYRIMDENCLSSTGLLEDNKCNNSFHKWIKDNDTYGIDNVQCTAFINFALECIGRSPVRGNAKDWLWNARYYDVRTRLESIEDAPIPGDILVFSGGAGAPNCSDPAGCGHVAVVVNVVPHGDSLYVDITGSNLGEVNYRLLFSRTGALVESGVLESAYGLKYEGILRVK